MFARTPSMQVPRARLLAWVLGVAAVLVAGMASAPAARGADSWIVLESGRLGEYLWSVKTKSLAREGARAGSQGAQRPCLMVGTKWQLSPYSFRRGRYRQCADTPGPLAATTPPLIASGVVPTSGPRPKLTAVGIMVASGVRRVEVTLAGGARKTIRPKVPSAQQRRKAGLGGLRYAAFSVRGPWCVERVVSRTRAGRTLFDSGISDALCGADAG